MKRTAHSILPSIACALLSGAALVLPGMSVRAAEVTIYRCTDGKGQVALRDTPCRAGEKQETRAMMRPTDPPPRALPPASTPGVARPASEPATRYVMVTPAQPLYECVGGDGERYTSESGQGRARWEPLWTYGYPAVPMQPGGGVSANIGFRSGDVRGHIRVGDPGHPSHHGTVLVPAVPTGQWVYDECHRLPQAEVCDRLRDERYALNRRWNIAQPSERAQIDRETRGIDARLANDCGGS